MSNLNTWNRDPEHPGRTLIGNWFEERKWGEAGPEITEETRGKELTAQPGYEHKAMKTTYRKSYKPPDVKARKVPPRQARREQADMESVSKTLQEEQLAAEDNSIRFTRGRFLHEPQLQENLDLDYMTDEPITIWKEKRPNGFGKDSHFTRPIGDYEGNRTVKDD